MSRAPSSPPDPAQPDASARPARGRRLLAVLSVVVVALVVTAAAGAARALQERSTVDTFCSRLDDARGLGSALGALDAEAVRAQLPALDALADSAPEEIGPAVAELARVVRSLSAALDAEVPGEAEADRQRRVEQVWRDHHADVVGIESAGRAVAAYADTTCGTRLS